MFKYISIRDLLLGCALLILALILISICCSPSALAQLATPITAPVSVSQVNLSYWLQFFLSVASISVPVFLTLIGIWAQAHFKVAKDSAASATIDLAVTAGTQAVAAAIANAPTTASIGIKNKAIADWVNTLSSGTQAAMALRGTTAATVASRIDGALTLALTPPAINTVVVPPAPAPAPATA